MKVRLVLFILIILAYAGQVSAQLNASFVATKYFSCPPLVDTFTSTSTGNPTTYFWDLGNSTTATTPVVITSYPNSGVYNVKLIVSNGVSTDSFIVPIRVYAVAHDSFNSYNNIGCSTPCHTVNLLNETVPGNAPVAQYVWDFGDQTSDTGYNASHCYSHPGKYTVTLISIDTNGCQTSTTMPNFVVISAGPTATLSASPLTSCTQPLTVNFTGSGSSPNGQVTYQLFYGNGSTSAQPDGTTQYNDGIFYPYLVVTDSLGCSVNDTVEVQVTQIVAGFTSTSTQACSDVPMAFTDTSNFASSWSWNFGDGGTSTLQNPTHTYSTNGTYTVTLTVKYNGCTGTATQTNYIHVTSPINFTFSGSPTGSCSPPLTVNFTNTAVGAASYFWTFGDGATSTLADPTHTYFSKGADTVTLGVANAAGCVNTKVLPDYIVIGGLNALFTVDSPQGCSPLTVHFADSSTATGAITSYAWNFGDGSTSNVADPTHTYTTGGQYKPTLVIKDAGGCSDTFSLPSPIIVGTTLIPNFFATPTTQCVDQTISFTNETQDTTSLTKYLWEFGDGGTSTSFNPTHAFADTGTFSVTLIVNNQGCPNDTIRKKYITIVVPKAQFLFKFSCASPTSVTFKDTSIGADTWFWEFGDGTTYTGEFPPVHTYPTTGTYTVVLVVTNTVTGCTDSSMQKIPIGTPQAAFTSNTDSGCVALEVGFTDNSSFASAWKWYFGDGDSSSIQNPINVYPDTGQYTVTLIINPGLGCSDTIRKVDYISVYGVSPKISVTPTSGCVPFTVSFKDSSTSYKGTIVSWDWNFADGDTSNLQNPFHTYTSAANGTYLVKLSIKDSHGCVGGAAQFIVPQFTQAGFTADSQLCAGEAVQFTNTSIKANSYIWNFGDGGTSTAVNPTHAYTSNGFYTVTLISILSPPGCRDTLSRTSFINIDTPQVGFYDTSDFSPCPPFPVRFFNTTTRGGLSWFWTFTSGPFYDTSTAESPLHVFLYPGDYTVTLVATDSFGCVGRRDSIDMINVLGPIGLFNVSPDTGCVPLTVHITGQVFKTVSIIATLGDGSPPITDSVNIAHTYDSIGIYPIVFDLVDTNGCNVAYPVGPVVVGLIPYPNLIPDTSICAGNPVQFNLTEGNYFVWRANKYPDYLSCDTCPDPISTSPDTITYYVTATTNYGCQASDTETVYVAPQPVINKPEFPYQLCPTDTFHMNVAVVSPNVQWTWSPDSFISATNIPDPTVWSPDTITYRVTGFYDTTVVPNPNGQECSVSKTITVYPIKKVLASVNFADTTLCYGASVSLNTLVLQASSIDTSFQWIPTAYLIPATGPDVTVTNPPPGSYTYVAIASSKGCVADTNRVSITITAAPDIVAGPSEIVTPGTIVQLYVASHDSVAFQWTPSSDSLSCTTCARPFITVEHGQVIYVSAEDDGGCKSTDSVVLTLTGCNPQSVFVPNTFTPNNDGMNDILYVRGGGLTQLEYFRVFDRWGQLVFETQDISQGWDGTVKGKPASISTYVYVLKAVCTSGDVVSLQGNVTLIR